MLTKEERETIINFNEAEDTACIEVPSGTKMHKRLLAIGLTPNADRVYGGHSEFSEFEFPKRWIKINPGRTLTVEQRAKCSDRARKNFSPTKLEL